MQEAAENALERMKRRLDSHQYGAVVAIDRCGNLGIHFNIKKMVWATKKDGILNVDCINLN